MDDTVGRSKEQAVDIGSRSLRVAIIGAGMSGILAAIRLRETGVRDISIFEKADRLGGTWRDNTYPGLTCDVPSHLYRYTFEPNPDWSRRFSPGPEIRRYFEGVAERHAVDGLIRTNSEIVRSTFRDSRWELETIGGDVETFDAVICCTGVLHHPKYPDIEGLDGFAGDSFHTARWNHDVSLKGKRVGIIGTGSTAMQVTSAIVGEVGHLSLFQRTAQWVVPLPNPEIPEPLKQRYRENPEEMDGLYDHLSERFVDTFARAVIGDREEMAKVEENCVNNLMENVSDPDLRAKLTPDYKVACKRLIMTDQFYPAIQQPNAELVTDGIERVEAGGVRTVDGHLHELDVLVLATGYHAHDFMRPMNVTGRDGLTIDEAWAEANEAYRSVAVPGFPNFFMVAGPNSPIGNFSLIQVAEVQLDYIMQLIRQLQAREGAEVEPKAEATQRFNDEIKAAMTGTVWVTGCNSWYLDKNGNPALYPWDFQHFRQDMAAPNLDDFLIA